MIQITEGANEHLSRIVREQDIKGIELGVKGGGCAGFTYEWDLVKDTPLPLDRKRGESFLHIHIEM